MKTYKVTLKRENRQANLLINARSIAEALNVAARNYPMNEINKVQTIKL